MKVIVDYDVCASTGSCMQVCPEVFEVRSDGYLYVLQEEPAAELHDKVAKPPTSARRAPSPSRSDGLPRPAGQGLGHVGLDAVRRARPRSGAVPRPARRRAGRHRALLHGDRRRHRRPGLRVQAADRPLRRAARRAPARSGLPRTSASATPTSCSCSTPSAATSARPPSTTPARRSAATAPTPSPSTRTSAPTPSTPFLEHGGVLALCRTSNAGSGELQDLDVGGDAAVRAGRGDGRRRWSPLGDCGLVVGATYPEQLAGVRRIVGDLPILVPGVGVQGGDVAASVAAGSTGPGTGLIASSSRAILYASSGDDFAEAARAVARAHARRASAPPR